MVSFPFLFVLRSLIISPALLLTLVDSDFKLPFDTIDEIDKKESLFSSQLPVYFIALAQSNEQWKRFERELSHLPPNLTATIHLKRAPAVTMADLKPILEKESSFPSKARQRVYLELTRNRDAAQRANQCQAGNKALRKTVLRRGASWSLELFGKPAAVHANDECARLKKSSPFEIERRELLAIFVQDT